MTKHPGIAYDQQLEIILRALKDSRGQRRTERARLINRRLQAADAAAAIVALDQHGAQMHRDPSPAEYDNAMMALTARENKRLPVFEAAVRIALGEEGFTRIEVMFESDIPEGTAFPRCTDLHRLGLTQKIDEKRSSHGRGVADVWVLTELGWNVAERLGLLA